MKRRKSVWVLAALIPAANAVIIWALAAFVRFDYDLSTMQANDRGGLVVGWALMCALSWAALGIWYNENK